MYRCTFFLDLSFPLKDIVVDPQNLTKIGLRLSCGLKSSTWGTFQLSCPNACPNGAPISKIQDEINCRFRYRLNNSVSSIQSQHPRFPWPLTLAPPNRVSLTSPLHPTPVTHARSHLTSIALPEDTRPSPHHHPLAPHPRSHSPVMHATRI